MDIVIKLSKEEIEELLFPYEKEHVYLEKAEIQVEPPRRITLKALCRLPIEKPAYLKKEISYVTATEGLALVTRSFILMFVMALTHRLLPELWSTDSDVCRDPEVFTLSVALNCKKRVQRNWVSVKVWLDEGWTVEKRNGRSVFKGIVKFEVEEGRWDGSVETFIWLERP